MSIGSIITPHYSFIETPNFPDFTYSNKRGNSVDFNLVECGWDSPPKPPIYDQRHAGDSVSFGHVMSVEYLRAIQTVKKEESLDEFFLKCVRCL